MDMPGSTTFQRFLSIPVEDNEARARIGLTGEEIAALHDRAVRGDVPWGYYHEVNNALKADFIYRKDGKQRGWTIAFIREQLNFTHTKEYVHKGERIHETHSGRMWPKARVIERVRSRQEPVSLVHELEIALSPEADLEAVWESQHSELEKEGIELLQQYPEDQFIQDMAFSSPARQFSGSSRFQCRNKEDGVSLPHCPPL